MSSQELKLAVNGLFISPNPFGSSPEGSFSVADNCVSHDQGILESRRGYEQQSILVGGQRATSFQDHALVLAADTLNYYAGGAWHVLAGLFSAPDADNPVRFAQAAKVLLFTTSSGVEMLSTYNGTPRLSGVPRAFPVGSPFDAIGSITGSTDASTAWFPDTYKVNYWLVCGYQDPNTPGVPILGSPSAAFTVYNDAGATIAPTIPIVYPAALDSYPSAFVRLYRSVAVATGEPLEEGFLAQEIPLSSVTPIAPNFFTVTDTTAPDNLGAALYTNSTAEGAAASNDRPPLARDICTFKGYTFFANTTDYSRLLLRLLTIGGATGLAIGDTITIAGITYTASNTELQAGHAFRIFPSSFSKQARIALTLESLVRCVRYVGQTPLAYYLDALCQADVVGADPTFAGRLLFESLVPDGSTFAAVFGATTYNIFVGDLTRTLASTIVTVTQALHPYAVGMSVTVAGLDPNFPAGTYTVLSVPDANHWTYDQQGALANATSVSLYTATHYHPATAWQQQANYNSDDSRDPAGLRFSKVNQPDAAPLADQDTVGDPGAALLRVLPLRDSVLIFKEDGIYRLTGTTPADFAIQPYDLTTIVTAPETVRALSNTALAWTSKGIWAFSESGGGSSISKPIDDALFELQRVSPGTSAQAFAVAYESEQQYHIWLPVPQAENPGFPYTLPIDFGAGVLPGGQAYVFNGRTSLWTRDTTVASDAIIFNNALFLVDGGQVLTERKTGTVADYQDVGGSSTITLVADTTHIVMVGPDVGDLVTQGSNSSHVLERSGSTLTMGTAVAWSTGAATYARAIDCVATWLPASGENPGTTKNFRELSLNFRLGQFSWIHTTFSTDVTPTAVSKLRYGDPGQPLNVNIRTLMPVNMARGVVISCGFEHQQALCNFQLQSASLVYREISQRTPSKGAP